MKLNIACVQFSPKVGQFDYNLSRATKLVDLAFSSIKKPDFVILPELALTGYNFPSKSAIEPFLEFKGTGPTTNWAIDLSKKYRCFTLVGYPEKFLNIEVPSPAKPNSIPCDKFTIFNSAVLISPSGTIIKNYRKSFLYETDYVWGCEEGPGFENFPLILDKNYYLENLDVEAVSNDKVINTAIGICMDLSPYKFEAPFNKFEFSNFCLSNNVKLILCPMAWLSPKSPSLNKSESKKEKKIKGNKLLEILNCCNININEDSINSKKSDHELSLRNGFENSKGFVVKEPDISNINYWILRFFPFLNNVYKHEEFDGTTIVVFANRAGIEEDVLYVGSSTILTFNGKRQSDDPHGKFDAVNISNPSVEVHGSLGQGEDAILVREVEL